MASLFTQVFACCLRTRHQTSPPHERTPLIPSSGVVSPSLNHNEVVVDHRKTKERLGVIVRSKEGKMVNVLSAVPFNLRHEPSSARGNMSSSRSGRSVSANQNHLPTVDSDGSLTSLRSPRPSLGATSRSHSATSLHPGSASYIPPLEDGIEREPILNVRLVGGLGPRQSSSRRSRQRGRLGRFGEDRRVEEQGEDRTTFDRHGDDSGVDINASDGEGVEDRTETTSPARERPEVKPLSDDDRITIKSISSGISSTLQEGFKIQDVGTISRGWGD